MSHPHFGNIKRDSKIFDLFDSGEYSLKEIASQITCMGWHCSVEIVRGAIKRRARYAKFYAERFNRFPPLPNIETN